MANLTLENLENKAEEKDFLKLSSILENAPELINKALIFEYENSFSCNSDCYTPHCCRNSRNDSVSYKRENGGLHKTLISEYAGNSCIAPPCVTQPCNSRHSHHFSSYKEENGRILEYLNADGSGNQCASSSSGGNGRCGAVSHHVYAPNSSSSSRSSASSKNRSLPRETNIKDFSSLCTQSPCGPIHCGACDPRRVSTRPYYSLNND